MSILSIENWLVNSSFLILLITTFVYWIQLGFLSKSDWILVQWSGPLGLMLSNVAIFALLVCRWIESHHFPLSNLYESLLFLCWSLTFCSFILGNFGSNLLIGCLIAPSALFVDAFASFTLPDTLKLASPLVPALQSNWLIMHVTIMIVSYSLLILGSLFSVAILILGFVSKPTNNLEPVLDFLDNLSYRTLGLGFPLLTIGILSGAVWANQAWGSYWSWDPKETWAFITWVIFAIYLHFRLNANWRGTKPALVASIGFVFLWICYLGVNLLGKGLHSYGWFT